MPSIPLRTLGSAQVPAIGLGAMGLSIAYGPVGTDEERMEFLDAAVARGSTFIDSADVYGDNEDLIGKWLKKSGKRDQIFLATKFAWDYKSAKPGEAIAIKGDPEFVRAALESSLQRLGVDSIDLWYAHRSDPKTPIETTVETMASFVKAGKVRYLGLSDVSADTLRRACKVHPIAAIQVEFSPFVLDIEDEKIGLLKVARELGVKIVAYSPLGRGLLTGQVKSYDDLAADDFRRFVPKFSKENFPKILKVVSELEALGKKYNATSGQVTLAWVLAQGEDFFVIPGTKKVKYLEENIGAADIKLSQEDIDAIRKIAEDAQVSIEGNKMPPGMQEMSYIETPPLA